MPRLLVLAALCFALRSWVVPTLGGTPQLANSIADSRHPSNSRFEMEPS